MPSEKYELITGVIVATIVFLFIAFFILALLAYINHRKKAFIQEKQILHDSFSKTLLQSQLEIQEQTFNQISEEIHDNVGQILSLAKVQVNIMNESGEMNREMLNEVKEYISKALTDLRDIAKSLNSERVRTLNIDTTVAYEVERINKSGIAYASITIEGEERKMDEQKKLILFRIVQESLQNIIKHADAKEVEIRFNYLPDLLRTIIWDNGKGFDTGNKSSGLGLSNIKTRATLAGGGSHIESKPGDGTTIIINMPYE